MRSHYAQKRDDNEKAIVKALRAAGAHVQAIGRPVDLLVGYHGLWHVLEVKDGRKPPSAQKLTRQEVEFVLDLKNRAPVHVVRNVEEALGLLGMGGAQ